MLRNLLRWLPAFRDLDYEQQEAVNRSLEQGGNLIYGPAGSGKTAITLYRAKTLADLKKEFILFVFTNALKRFIEAGANDLQLQGAKIRSFYKWVWDAHGHMFGPRGYPQGDDKFDVMVDNLIRRWKANPSEKPHYEYVLVDEAQDFRANVPQLLHMLTGNLLIAADPAQSLYVETKGLRALQERWQPLREPVIVRHNYRNPRPIAELASLFVDPNVSTPQAFLETVKGKPISTKPIWHEVSSDQAVAEKIKGIVDDVRGDKRVGILCRRRNRPQSLKKALNDLGIETQIALSNSQDDYDFNSAIPVLTTLHSAKGLEFDWVILPDLNANDWDGDDAGERRLFFVGLTRAKERLYLLSRTGRPCLFMEEIQQRAQHLIQRPSAGTTSTGGARTYHTTMPAFNDEDSPF